MTRGERSELGEQTSFIRSGLEVRVLSLRRRRSGEQLNWGWDESYKLAAVGSIPTLFTDMVRVDLW